MPKLTDLCLFSSDTALPDHDSARRYAQNTLDRATYAPDERNLAAAYLSLTSKQVVIPEVARSEFDAWYREYPRKKHPDAAFRAYRTARKVASAGELLTALRGYRWSNDDPKYLPYPATWLNGGAWRENPLDEPAKRSQVDVWAQAARSALGGVAQHAGDFFTIDGEAVHGQ